VNFTDLTWTSDDGLALYARDYAPKGPASGVPVVCIHGLTRNARDFEDLAPRIAALGRRVLAVDIRGRGRSARDPQPLNYHPGTYAGDIAALLDATAIDRAIFVGTSMGGIIAMILASIKPEAIVATVLNDVGPELSPVGLARISGYVGGASTFAAWDAATAYAKTINGAAFPTYTDADWAVFARRLVDEGPDGTLTLAYDPDISVPFRTADSASPAPNMYPLFHALAACGPVLLVRGALSDLIDPPIAARMRAAAPHMAYVEVPEVGHAPTLTEPAAWKALDAFLGGASLDAVAT
jgi:pimeloyl-ACP methyl ester carboxylesterase